MTTRIPLTQITLPGHHAPGAGFEEPFEMLAACHERVTRMLNLLARLREHLSQKGWDASVGQAAQDVMRYFDQAAPKHHDDEERHVFPALLAAPDTGLHAVVHRLQQDHIDMTAGWARARTVLATLVDGPATLDVAANQVLADYAALYDRHVEDEDKLVYPAARQLLSADAVHAMSADMMARRGI
jgi:hemerythrin-like domain-containing protein